MEEGMSEFNRTIHEPTRLRIMSALMALGPNDRMQFVALRDMLDLTDGNLGAHLLKLEAKKLVAVNKKFVSRKPCTFVSPTPRGRAAFEEHVNALKEILAAAPGEEAVSERKSKRGTGPNRKPKKVSESPRMKSAKMRFGTA
jgi:DNA-binding MarR family transcriptional regulator